MLPLVRENYGAYEVPAINLLLGAPVLIAAYGLLALLFMKPRSDDPKAFRRRVRVPLCYLLQAKGWRYQGLPAIGCFAMMSALALRQLPAAAFGALAILYALATTNAQESHVYAPTIAATRDLKPGSSVLVLSPYAGSRLADGGGPRLPVEFALYVPVDEQQPRVPNQCRNQGH